MTSLPEPGVTPANWGAQLNDAILAASSGVDAALLWGDELGYDINGDDTGWSWFNQDSSTRTVGEGAVVIANAGTGSDRVHARMRAIPSESTWTMTAKLSGPRQAADYGGWGLIVHDSGASKTMFFGPSHNGEWLRYVLYWAAGTGAPAIRAGTADGLAFSYRYWRIRKNSGTSWDFQYSEDGHLWSTHDAARNITSDVPSPTHIGFGMWHASRTISMACEWLRIR